ncbi:1,4-alpha-glucan branching protein GlgB [Methylorubrum extorquens]|uniref:1,4-alpha-glucan branching enzyme GlgB n=1 Tax=Methylorubrum extorquens (strain ATCC 14718 / DSM 1338 / JCM 2805 / NCIMB 9133 / AM1) TaxID=272630 RepID=C5B1Q7_METEA|nr:1,4-alpha-glucan branching protein GlgB [Methylorubrum extorquens]ACS39691.1 1,4-alpha-glucan branching enzyme, glycogen synthesis [Methylorubrum extorquens AM1]MCP1590464.1 1,4-alpha-glucan branching enzyme [Methylorubrum extorquens]
MSPAPSYRKLSNEALAAVVNASHGDPFDVLGPHEIAAGLWEIRAVLPEARIATVVGPNGKRVIAPMERTHEAGFFTARFSSRARPKYRLRLETENEVVVRDDPYRFRPILTDEGLLGIAAVGSDAVYENLGAHRTVVDGVTGFIFAVWAPNARRVSVVGDFNAWDGRRHPMRLRHNVGVWELFIPDLEAGVRYKFEIKGADGNVLPLKVDPVAFATECPPATASILRGPPHFAWRDEAWIAKRAAATDPRKSPISIYECHLGSWARAPKEGGRYLTYPELAERLIPYVKDLGFTHLELLPIAEHPFNGSWGYQPVSLFAPTSRFGAPEDFAAFVAAAHEAGIGVILDWVPGHFPNDPHGLAYFDGTHLYEHADPRQGHHQDWGTHIYNYGRQEVATFLVANARFWLERYHLDGLRVDAVASMLYLDYSRRPGEWVPNRYGGNESLDAIDFLRRTNEVAYGSSPGVITVAEESTAWPGVSHPAYTGGLGFGFKWNMGWMHDTLRYISQDPVHRRYHHHDLTFSLLYAFTENFILPLSHDEVVHGKGSLLSKMPGDRWQRFTNLRAYLAFMWGHPGKKLLFMGGEFGQEREWNHDQSLDWHLLEDPFHRGLQQLVRDLNHVYRATPALHEHDCEASGFRWLVSDDRHQNVLAFARHGNDPDQAAIVVSNVSPVPRHGYQIGIPVPGFYGEIVNTDGAIYGGSNMGNLGGAWTTETPSHGQPCMLTLTLPPLATIILERRRI